MFNISDHFVVENFFRTCTDRAQSVGLQALVRKQNLVLSVHIVMLHGQALVSRDMSEELQTAFQVVSIRPLGIRLQSYG
jgi:hypothetical protein